MVILLARLSVTGVSHMAVNVVLEPRIFYE